MATLYTALVYPQVGAGGSYTRPTVPASFVSLAYTSPGWNPFSAVAADRTEYWLDTAGTLALDDILLAMYGLDGIKAQKMASLVMGYQTAIQQPVSFTSAGGVTKTFQTDTDSLTKLQQMITAYAAGTPAGFYWKALDNTKVPFTLPDLQGLALAAGNQGWTAFQNLQTKAESMYAASTVAAVQAITY